MAKKLPPMHPGEVLREEFLVPLHLSAGALAKACGLPRTRIERIAAETIGISATPRFGSARRSERPRPCGSTCRPITTSRGRAGRSAKRWRASRRSTTTWITALS